MQDPDQGYIEFARCAGRRLARLAGVDCESDPLSAESREWTDCMIESRILRDLWHSAIVKQGRRSVLITLAARFDESVAEACKARLRQIEDTDKLRDLLRLAVKCATPDEFRAALPEPQVRSRQRSTRRKETNHPRAES